MELKQIEWLKDKTSEETYLRGVIGRHYLFEITEVETCIHLWVFDIDEPIEFDSTAKAKRYAVNYMKKFIKEEFRHLNISKKMSPRCRRIMNAASESKNSKKSRKVTSSKLLLRKKNTGNNSFPFEYR